MGSRRMVAGIAAIVVAAGAAGCGSSGDEQQTAATTTAASMTTPATTPATGSATTPTTTAAPTPGRQLTRAEFRSAAIAICRAADAQLDRTPFPERTADFPAWAARRAAVSSAQIEQLEALTPPDADQEAFSDFIRGLSTARDQVVPFWQAVADADGQMSRVDDRYGIEVRRTSRTNERLARALRLGACV